MLINSNELLLYVGTSRARHQLYVLAEFADEDIDGILEFMNEKRRKNPYRTIAKHWNAEFVEN